MGLSKKDKDALAAAKRATDKLNKYSKGLPKGSVETPKYTELNGKANEALNKLPKHLRSRTAVEWLG